jgi:hypothetical protein
MQIRRPVSVSVSAVSAAVIGCAVLLACKTDYQQGLEDPHFGLPNSLSNQTQPGPSSDLTTPTGTSGASGASGIACVKAGGAEVDGGPCAFSFKTDVLGAFNTAQCAQAGCHGGTNPPSQPRIDPADGPGMWNEFAAFKMTNGKLYVNPCSTDPTQSGIAVNVNGAASAADRGSLMPLGSNGLAADVVTKLEGWTKCGAPNN